MDTWHLTIASRDRDHLWADERELLRLVQHLTQLGGPSLVAFCIVDDHLHSFHVGPRRRVGAVASGMSQTIATATEPAFIKEVRGRSYRNWLLRYILTQVLKHRLPGPPALWSGSSFLDLVGARLLPGFDRTVVTHVLPRTRVDFIFQELGLTAEPILPGDELCDTTVHELTMAAMATLGVNSAMSGKAAQLVAARRLAAWAARAHGLSATELARYLDLDPSSVRRLARSRPPASHVDALRTRLALERRLITPQVSEAQRFVRDQ